MANPKQIFFMYPAGGDDSGQRKASELLYGLLPGDKWKKTVLLVPALNRKGKRMPAMAAYLLSLAWSWVRILWNVRGISILHCSICQTAMALIRDGVPIFVVKNLWPEVKLVVSMHGSNFMQWEPGEWKADQLSRLLQMAEAITVLGPSQKKKLMEVGIPGDRIQVLDNCSEFQPISEREVNRKHRKGDRPDINILFLSNLIDTKGYPVFLEALEMLSCRTPRMINAVMCGRLVCSQFSERFSCQNSARQWIKEKLSIINQSSNVRIKWIEGAWGDAKKALFQKADIFVIPTTYKVEAQPIVILEAMAHGCAVITSRVGEISSIVSDSEAILLEAVDRASVIEAMVDLVHDDRKRALYGKNGWERYKESFTPGHYLDRWESLLYRIKESPLEG